MGSSRVILLLAMLNPSCTTITVSQGNPSKPLVSLVTPTSNISLGLAVGQDTEANPRTTGEISE